MALGTRTRETTRAEFKEVGQTGVFLALTESNLKDSLSMLGQNGLRPLTYQEAIDKIDKNLELKEKLKGMWFYLDGEGLALSGYYTFDDKGQLTQGKGDIEKTIHIYKGQQPLSFDVLSNDDSGSYERRYDLNAHYGPFCIAPVIVGVKISHSSDNVFSQRRGIEQEKRL